MILLGPLSDVPHAIKAYNPSHLVSLLDREKMIDTPAGILPQQHLRLILNDITDTCDGLIASAHHHITQLVEFVKEWDRQKPLLIHCWIGISRSTAAAYTALCALNENHSENEIANLLRACVPHAAPNLAMVAIADEILGRQGRMRHVIETLGPASSVYGHLAELPSILPASK